MEIGELTDELKARIDRLSHFEMARAHRFDPIGSPIHQGAAGEYFQKRFKSLGGMTPAISKSIG